jgi:hypothetical protein
MLSDAPTYDIFLNKMHFTFYSYSCILYLEVDSMENVMFDYRSFGDTLSIPLDIVQNFEEEAQNEFPFDNMLKEIHILRAIKAYARTNERMVNIEK